ncbi:hypothetical protein SDC9_197069 [bioreactor metagenome]|uniref:Uncharacterized protein n=1 Tax=bioreactor metagenome TaxID=1076179 RepID=A0A645IDR3_9ZZZZ
MNLNLTLWGWTRPMTLKQKKNKTDQEKHNHRDSYKGHRTRYHFISKLREKEADESIREVDSHLPLHAPSRVD